jgi:hypothetical protein
MRKQISEMFDNSKGTKNSASTRLSYTWAHQPTGQWSANAETVSQKTVQLCDLSDEECQVFWF